MPVAMMDSGLALRAPRNDADRAMLNVILTIKFVHMITMAVMFGTWLAIALFAVSAHRSGNTSVVALTSVFTVRAELWLMAPALALQPLAGFPLAAAIGARVTEYWIEASVAIYAGVVVVWLASLIVELRIRKESQEAALAGEPLPESYRRKFRVWSVLAFAGIAGMTAIMALMIWQPHWE